MTAALAGGASLTLVSVELRVVAHTPAALAAAPPTADGAVGRLAAGGGGGAFTVVSAPAVGAHTPAGHTHTSAWDKHRRTKTHTNAQKHS